MDRAAITRLVKTSLDDILGAEPDLQRAAIADTTPLIGRGAVVDSLGLVQLIVDVEQRLQDEREVAITIADDRAMSQQHSPFKTVGTLVDYIWVLAAEPNGHG